MACAGRFANGHPCTYPAKRYGVCGRHSKQAADYTNVRGFVEFVDEYTNLIRQYHEATQELEQQGLDLLSIQGAFNYNLCGPQVRPLGNPLLQRCVDSLHAQNECSLRHQQRFDPYLVCNVASRISHGILDPNCRCSLCSMKI